jgi:uncharacterized membrane protein YjdF
MSHAVDASFAHRALLGFSLTFVALGIAPVDRQSWFVENIMVLLVVGALWCKHSRPALSRSAWCATLVFLLIHQVGAHYTYPQVPYNAWLLNVLNFDLNRLMGWERNQLWATDECGNSGALATNGRQAALRRLHRLEPGHEHLGPV